jgi:hypothetical protein
LSALLACVSALASQTQQQPVFRGGIRLVTVNVTVVDDGGRPVRGLTAADFTVTIDDVRRPVQTVDLLEFGAARVSARDDAPAAARPGGALASRGARTFLLLFDDLSFTPLEGKGLRAAAERRLADLDPGDLVGVTTSSGLGPVVEPTRNRDTVRAAIRTLAGRNMETAEPFYIGINEAVAWMDRNDRAMAARVTGRECKEVDLGPQCPDVVRSRAFMLAAQARRRLEDQLTALQHVPGAATQAPAPRAVIVLSRGATFESAPPARRGLVGEAGIFQPFHGGPLPLRHFRHLHDRLV